MRFPGGRIVRFPGGRLQEFRMAIALNPNYALGYDWYGYYLTAMRRYDEAAVILNKAAELDPLSVRIATVSGRGVRENGPACTKSAPRW